MDQEMSYGDDYVYLPATSIQSGKGQEVLPDVFCHTIQIVNICMIGQPEKKGWVLVDAGMPQSVEAIISAAEERFGAGNRPQAIVLTHGHFDHVGAIVELIEQWNVPVYAHELELPYLTGKHVEPLPSDGSIPFLEGWRWLHTSGHTPGHISLFREDDRALIAGDAFVTVQQESIYKVLVQKQEISGPPKYFTPDWDQARQSVEKLEALKPNVAVTGHGLPMEGQELSDSLKKLVEHFDEIAIPAQGKYVH